MNISKSRSFVLACACFLSVGFSLGGPGAALAQRETTDIQQSMSPAEFEAAGLNKLNPAELQNLNQWLQGFREKAATKAVTREKLQLVVSRVDGVLNGVKSGQIIPLEDGSRWQITDRDVNFYGHVDHPAAAAFKSLFGWKIRIVGVGEYYVVPKKR